jgi:hypothetical protein
MRSAERDERATRRLLHRVLLPFYPWRSAGGSTIQVRLFKLLTAGWRRDVFNA